MPTKTRESRKIFNERKDHESREVQQHQDRHRRLDLRAVARHVLPRRSHAKPRTRIREPASQFDRNQRHVLRFAESRRAMKSGIRKRRTTSSFR